MTGSTVWVAMIPLTVDLAAIRSPAEMAMIPLTVELMVISLTVELALIRLSWRKVNTVEKVMCCQVVLKLQTAM